MTGYACAGVPAGTWIGQHISWRTAFCLIALIGVVTIASVA
ncbi:hypothetical protein [Raoultella terrigena]